jgi:hypothetical protein
MTSDTSRNSQAGLLHVENLVAGQVAQISVLGASPFSVVWVAYSLKGDGPTTILGQTALLTPPISLLPALITDSSGDAMLYRMVPSSAAGVRVWFHAMDINALQLTNGLGLVVG